MDDEFWLYLALPRAVVAAIVGAIGYLYTLYALNPGMHLFEQVLVWELANGIALGMAVLIFGVVFWRLMRGASMSDEFGKGMDIDGD